MGNGLIANMRRPGLRALFAALFGILAAGCGFKPIYATPEGVAPVNRQISLSGVSAPEEVHLFVVDALQQRIILGPDETPRYSLAVNATENARRLAVQIDATVTRFNYRLIGRYQLRDLQTGEVINGAATAVTSYNIVSSQYSTLFAEQTAREKAARLLAELIERDIILRLDDPDAPDPEPELETLIDTDTINFPRDNIGGDERPFLIEEADPLEGDGAGEDAGDGASNGASGGADAGSADENAVIAVPDPQ